MALPELVSPPREYRLLYRLVADHLETFLVTPASTTTMGYPAEAQKLAARPLPPIESLPFA